MGTNTIDITDEAAFTGSDTYLLVYTKSFFVEQSTPAALAVSDTSESVSSVTFADSDLDPAELAGVGN